MEDGGNSSINASETSDGNNSDPELYTIIQLHAQDLHSNSNQPQQVKVEGDSPA
jgi:hypothetical protein